MSEQHFCGWDYEEEVFEPPSICGPQASVKIKNEWYLEHHGDEVEIILGIDAQDPPEVSRRDGGTIKPNNAFEAVVLETYHAGLRALIKTASRENWRFPFKLLMRTEGGVALDGIVTLDANRNLFRETFQHRPDHA